MVLNPALNTTILILLVFNDNLLALIQSIVIFKSLLTSLLIFLRELQWGESCCHHQSDEHNKILEPDLGH